MNDEDEVLRMIAEGCPHCHDLDPPRVTGVRGRFPSRRQALRQEDIEVSVTELSPGVFTVRLDSRVDDEFWMQLTVTVGGAA